METENKTPEINEKNETTKTKLAIIRIRGTVGVRKDIKDTLEMLKLHNKHFCVVYDSNPSITGMVKKIKDYVTWGDISDDTHKKLIEKRGEKSGDELKPFFRLHPPRGGFERKGIKTSYTLGGVLGYRGKKINDLIAKML